MEEKGSVGLSLPRMRNTFKGGAKLCKVESNFLTDNLRKKKFTEFYDPNVMFKAQNTLKIRLNVENLQT